MTVQAQDLQDDLHALGYADLVRRSGVVDEGTTAAVRCFQRDAGLEATGVVDDAVLERLRFHRSDAPDAWLSRAARAAARVLELEGKRLTFGSDGVRAEVQRAALRERVAHNCDPAGVYLHPHMLETMLALADHTAYRVEVIRETHGKYQKIDDVTICEVEGATVSSHFLGQGVDFYFIGASVDSLVGREKGEEAWCEAAERIVKPFWDGTLVMPPLYWVVFPLGLADRYKGIQNNIKFFSNDRHWNHVHVGLDMNVPRVPA